MDEMDRSFDIEYWQRQGDEWIFRAAWELVQSHWCSQGRNPDELRVERTIEAYGKI
jgi:hypothetical protein